MDDKIQRARLTLLSTAVFGLSLYAVLRLAEVPIATPVGQSTAAFQPPSESVSPWCEHNLDEGQQLIFSPGEYINAGDYAGELINVYPGGTYTTKEWSCTNPFQDLVEGSWRREGRNVILERGVGRESTPRALRLVVDNGVLALHSIADHGFCYSIPRATTAEPGNALDRTTTDR